MDTLKKKEASSPEKWGKMLFACGGAIMISFFNGVLEAHSAVLLPQLQDPDSSIQITKDEGTWIASLGVFACPISAILCGPCIDYFGRKVVIQCYFLIGALGYGIIAAASSLAHLYIGRIFCSLGVGFEVASIIYIAEVCTRRQRSLYLSIAYSVYTGGILVTYAVGAILPWNLGSALYALLCLIMALYEGFTPESPPWLVKKGRIGRAVAELVRLGRKETDIAEEIKILQMDCEEKTNQRLEWRTFLRPTVWKPLVIISLFHFLEACTGTWDFLYYTVDLIDEFRTRYDPYLVSTGLAIVRFLTMSTVGSYCMSRMPRKTSTAISGFAMGASLLAAAAYESQYAGVAPLQRTNTWIPILAVFTSALVSCAGVLHLPWLMSGEVFPLHVRGTMNGVVYLVGCIFMFLSLKFYVFFIENLTIIGTLILFSIASVVIGLYGVFVLTETQNKSLQEIEASYQKKSKALIKDAEKT